MNSQKSLFLTRGQALRQNLLSDYYLKNHAKSNKYFILNESTKDFVKGVKYRVQYETPNCYCIRLKSKRHNDLFLNKSQENNSYIIGYIQNVI